MGQIVYCSRCQNRLTEADFRRGAAVELPEGFVCVQCAPELATPRNMPSAPAPPETARRKLKSSTARLEAPPPPASDEPSGGRRRTLLLALGGGGAVVGIAAILLVVLLSGKSDPRGRTETAPKIDAAAAEAREKEAMAALDKAHAFGTAQPDDLDGRLRELEKVERGYDKTSAAAIARKEIEALRNRLGGASEPGVPWAVKVRTLAADRDFKGAMALLERARKTGAAAGEVDRAEAEVLAGIGKEFSRIKEKAREAKEKNDDAGYAAAREELAKWGMDSYLADFDKEFAAKAEPAKAEEATTKPVVAAPKVRTEEGKAYLQAWQGAMALAIVRDYGAAVAALEKGKKGLKEGDSKTEQAADVKELKLLETLHKEAVDAAAKIPLGRKVKLGVLDASGSASTIEGEVVSSDAERIELRKEKQKTTSFVEPSELTAATLVDLVNAKPGKRPSSHPRTAALYCLLAGDAEAAKKNLGAALETLPEKYLEVAKDALQKLLPADPGAVRSEREAKQLFWTAGREWADVDSAAGAIEKYKTLVRDYVGKSIVIKNMALITRRSEVGKDYAYSAAALRGAGTFRLARHEKLESCWTAAADSAEDQTLRNYVEIAFVALPATEYRCWILVGGCCKEIYTFYYQASELTMPGEKRGETMQVDVGSPLAVPVKHSISGLKKDHAAHKPEKDDTRWEWIPIPLPKYASGGPKRVRLATNRKGLSIACAVVSSVRKSAPREAELINDLKAEVDWPGKRSGLDAGLVLHFTFESISGVTVEDASGQGNDGSVKGGAKAAKLAGAPYGGSSIPLDGKDEQISVAHSGSVDPAEGSFTLSLWLAPGGGEIYRLANKWNGKMGWVVDVNSSKAGSSKQTGKLRLKVNDGKNDADLEFDTGIPATGKAWTHLVVVVDRSGGEAQVYVNGKEVGKTSISGVTGSLSNTTPLTFGTLGSKPDKWFKGHLDEVRLYARALTSADVQSLFALR